MDHPHDGIRFECCGVWLSANDSVYIKEVGQAIAGDVVKEECYRVLTVFTNICCDCVTGMSMLKASRPNVADQNAASSQWKWRKGSSLGEIQYITAYWPGSTKSPYYVSNKNMMR